MKCLRKELEMNKICYKCRNAKECISYYEKMECDQYVPRGSEDDYIDYLIEEGRISFYGEWFQYIKEYE